MATSAYRRAQPAHPDAKAVEDRVAEAFERIGSNPFAQAVEIRTVPGGVPDAGVPLVMAGTDVEHPLNRAYRGFLVVRASAGAMVFDDFPNNPDPTRFIRLVPSAAVTVWLLVW